VLNYSKILKLEGWCGLEKSNELYNLVIDQKPKVLVEIGVFEGKSLFSQALALKENGSGKIYGIDPWSKKDSLEGLKEKKDIDWWTSLDYESIYNGCVDFLNKEDLHSHVELKKERSDEFIKTFQEPIDILHIDGNHEEESSVSDVNLFLPLVKNGGFVWFDDASWYQTQKAVKLMEEDHNCVLIKKIYDENDKHNFCSLYKKLGSTTLPKTFCITLKDHPKRTEYVENHFKQHDLDVELFEGINAKKFGLSTKIPYTDDHLNWDKDCGTPHFISQGHVGCILSHYMLWTIMEYLPYGEYLILEDDVELCEDFKEKLLDVKSRLPEDWQYCFVGNCCLNKEDSLQIDDGIIQTVTPPLCTHAYMIKKSALKTLIETNSIAWSHIDIQIQKRSLSNLNYYVLDPPLADQLSITNPGEIFESLTNSY
jgi:GR25 family glycosyltransferase involved in LPS biosynthesis/predicted O-methyltransferase YrrM